VRGAVAAPLLAAAWMLGGAGTAYGAPAGAERLGPDVVLARYERAIARVVAPKVLRFEYAVEQVGPHDIAQTHRVYRSGLTERDEMLSVEGQSLPTPAIRIIRNRVNRYNVASLAPRTAGYAFSYVGTHHEGSRVDYVFSTTARDVATPAYRVTGLTIDGTHFLPRTIAYATESGMVRGHGTLTFWPQGSYWVIAQATANARIGNRLARERLVFHNYDFPRSLPASTFIAPRAVASPEPAAALEP
jgi:hypothetical protein